MSQKLNLAVVHGLKENHKKTWRKILLKSLDSLTKRRGKFRRMAE
jgi:hypothetical protein